MRSTFLTTAILLCLGTAAVAADQNKDAQEQSQQAEQTQMAHYYEADKSMDHASSAKTHNAHKHGTHSKRNNQRSKPEGDPQASQNQVEYGGGG